MEKANLFDLLLGLLLNQAVPQHLIQAVRNTLTDLPDRYRPGRWSTYRELHHLLAKNQLQNQWLVWPRQHEAVKPASPQILWLFTDIPETGANQHGSRELRHWFDEMHRAIDKKLPERPWLVVVCHNWNDRWFRNDLQMHCESLALLQCPVLVLHCTDRAGSVQFVQMPQKAA